MTPRRWPECARPSLSPPPLGSQNSGIFRHDESSRGPHTMKTGMNLLLWTTHVTEEHFPLFAKLKQTGFDGVELPLFGGEADHYRKIRKELDNHGLACTTVTCIVKGNPISPDAATRQAGLDHIKWAIETSAI